MNIKNPIIMLLMFVILNKIINNELLTLLILSYTCYKDYNFTLNIKTILTKIIDKIQTLFPEEIKDGISNQNDNYIDILDNLI